MAASTRWRHQRDGGINAMAASRRYLNSPTHIPSNPPMTRRRFPVLDGQGSTVGTIELFQEQGHWWIERSPFVTTFRHIVDDGKVAALVHAIENHAWAALDRVDSELLPWYCSRCECNYAAELWSVPASLEEDESGERQSRRGKCPQGHERTIGE
jgi:hypothetical protein